MKSDANFTCVVMEEPTTTKGFIMNDELRLEVRQEINNVLADRKTIGFITTGLLLAGAYVAVRRISTKAVIRYERKKELRERFDK